MKNTLKVKATDPSEITPISQIIEQYPESIGYYSELVDLLKCDSIEDLITLSIHPDQEDFEGDNTSDFFPNGTKIEELRCIYDNRIAGMAFGYVAISEANGIPFIAEQNASPWIIYVNKNSVELIEDEK